MTFRGDTDTRWQKLWEARKYELREYELTFFSVPE